MDATFGLILNEMSNLHAARESTPGLLYKIDAFAITLISGLLIATQVYKVDILVLIAPLMVYLSGYLWSSESMRLLKIRDHLSKLETSARERLGKNNSKLPKGYESITRGRGGILFLLRHEDVMVASAIFYGAFWFFFLFLLIDSKYSLAVRIPLLGLYLTFGAVSWVIVHGITKPICFKVESLNSVSLRLDVDDKKWVDSFI